MKTKIILHGGFTPGNSNEDNHAFYEEILKGTPERVSILLIGFAKDTDRIPDAVSKVKHRFISTNLQKTLSFTLANEESLERQITSADIIYFHGGKTLKLLHVLQKFPNIKSLFKNKIIAGESAGANVLATFFYSPSADTVGAGLGLVPVKLMPHYSGDYQGQLDTVGKGLDLLLLPEYEYRIFWM